MPLNSWITLSGILWYRVVPKVCIIHVHSIANHHCHCHFVFPLLGQTEANPHYPLLSPFNLIIILSLKCWFGPRWRLLKLKLQTHSKYFQCCRVRVLIENLASSFLLWSKWGAKPRMEMATKRVLQRLKLKYAHRGRVGAWRGRGWAIEHPFHSITYF